MYYNSYGQLTQLHPEVDEYKMYYAQVRSDDHDIIIIVISKALFSGGSSLNLWFKL